MHRRERAYAGSPSMKVDRIGTLHNSYLCTRCLRVRHLANGFNSRRLLCELHQTAAVGRCVSEVHGPRDLCICCQETRPYMPWRPTGTAVNEGRAMCKVHADTVPPPLRCSTGFRMYTIQLTGPEDRISGPVVQPVSATLEAVHAKQGGACKKQGHIATAPAGTCLCTVSLVVREVIRVALCTRWSARLLSAAQTDTAFA